MATSQSTENGNCQDQLTLFAEDPRVKASHSQASEKAWKSLAETSHSHIFPFLIECAPVGSLSKTCLAYCHQTTGGTLAPSSEGWQSAGMGSPMQFLTLKTLESRNAAEECSLSDILEETGSVPGRYYLTRKACLGILRRAEKRKAELPKGLEKALRITAKHTE